MPRQFLKMHGAGNDFVIFDAREKPLSLTPQQVREVAARDNKGTFGCDQVIVLEPAAGADVFMRIYNADGGEVDACGNATRCVAWLIMQEKDSHAAAVQTKAGVLHCTRGAEKQVTVDMGPPQLEWQKIPLAHEMDTLHTGIVVNDVLKNPAAVGMGNPHAVFFLNDPAILPAMDMAAASKALQPYYPEGVNVSVAYITSYPEQSEDFPTIIDVRVYERGAGETPACGTAACAVMVAAWLREPVSDHALVRFQPSGYALGVEWQDGGVTETGKAKGNVLLTGPVHMEFNGVAPL